MSSSQKLKSQTDKNPLREERVLFEVDRVWWSMRTPVGSRRGVLSEGDGADAASDVDAFRAEAPGPSGPGFPRKSLERR
jgi:hypothetical protein